MECIKIDFDVLETKNPKKLMIGDTSQEWLHAKDLQAYLYITLPGSTKPKVFEFEKSSIKVFNSDKLGITKDTKDSSKYADLPDGIYKIRLQSGFEEHYSEKSYLKTDILEREIRKSIIMNALNISSTNDAFIEKVFEVDWKLKVAKAFAFECNLSMATRYYNEALQMFKCLK